MSEDDNKLDKHKWDTSTWVNIQSSGRQMGKTIEYIADLKSALTSALKRIEELEGELEFARKCAIENNDAKMAAWREVDCAKDERFAAERQRDTLRGALAKAAGDLHGYYDRDDILFENAEQLLAVILFIEGALRDAEGE